MRAEVQMANTSVARQVTIWTVPSVSEEEYRQGVDFPKVLENKTLDMIRRTSAKTAVMMDMTMVAITSYLLPLQAPAMAINVFQNAEI